MKYLTQEGFEKLKKELEDRKLRLRRKIAVSIKEAKEQGDLSENAEYSEAKRQQRENESRIMFLENAIRTCKVVKKETQNNNETVRTSIGSKIKVLCKNKQMDFFIVGSNESDPLAGKISNESPMGKAFLGKKRGDLAVVSLPNGKKVEYKILEIK